MAKRIRKNENQPQNNQEVAKKVFINFLNKKQADAFDLYKKNDVLFLTGIAGCGKSHCAMAFAINDILSQERQKIIISRPIVEAGERLGFLPGTLDEKVAPYMMPLYDCLNKISTRTGDGVKRLIEKSIEVAPLAYLRGRAQPLTSIVMTPTGPKHMKDIKINDYVIGKNGLKTKVTGVYPQGIKDIVEITFDDGSKTKCCKEHLWLTQSSNSTEFTVKTTEKLIKDMKSKIKHKIPLVSQFVEFEKNDVEESPYELGFNIGIKNSYIPNEYKYNSIETRLSVFIGLFSSIGKVRKNCDYVKFTTISSDLADDILFLTESFGGYGIKTIKIDKKNQSKLYEVKSFLLDIIDLGCKKSSKCYRTIVSIKDCGKEECQCIKVDAIDHLYLTDHFIVTHNTFENSIAILDEAQNCSSGQLKLFLTRLGANSKIIITGDPSQSDLYEIPDLVRVSNALKNISGIGHIEFDDTEVVRHPLISEIIKKI